MSGACVCKALDRFRTWSRHRLIARNGDIPTSVHIPPCHTPQIVMPSEFLASWRQLQDLGGGRRNLLPAPAWGGAMYYSPYDMDPPKQGDPGFFELPHTEARGPPTNEWLVLLCPELSQNRIEISSKTS